MIRNAMTGAATMQDVTLFLATEQKKAVEAADPAMGRLLLCAHNSTLAVP